MSYQANQLDYFSSKKLWFAIKTYPWKFKPSSSNGYYAFEYAK